MFQILDSLSLGQKIKDLLTVVLGLALLIIALIAIAIAAFIFGSAGYMIQALTIGVTGSWTDPGFLIGASIPLFLSYAIIKGIQDDLSS